MSMVLAILSKVEFLVVFLVLIEIRIGIKTRLWQYLIVKLEDEEGDKDEEEEGKEEEKDEKEEEEQEKEEDEEEKEEEKEGKEEK